MIENSIVVVIDVLRATSTMTATIFNGAKEIIPVATLEECIERRQLPNIIMADLIKKATHCKRLSNLGIDDDVNFV